jgi:hypothetical protein
MKKLFGLLVFMVTLTSCSLDDDGPEFAFQIMPIESVDVPDSFIFGETYDISVTYDRPSDCYIFNDFIYDVEDNQRTVAVVNTVYDNSSCTPQVETMTAGFELTVSSFDAYIFRFYIGENEDGVDEYHYVEVPVLY